jgi:PIN domain nuclease of toxin-antitoxin system
MKLLLDTHIFIWWADHPEQLLPAALSALEDEGNELLLSVASVWEMQPKIQLGKLKLSLPLKELVKTQQDTNDLNVVPVELKHVLALDAELQAYCERARAEDVTRYERAPRCLHADCVYAGRVNGGVKMWNDPIVDEVRRVRLEIEKECEEDFALIYARALEVQKDAATKLVSRPGANKIMPNAQPPISAISSGLDR